MIEKWQEEVAQRLLANNAVLPSRGIGKSELAAAFAAQRIESPSCGATREQIIQGYELVPHVSYWQTPWTGKNDPFSYHRSGKWFGYGITSQFERPLTVHKLVSMIAYGTSSQGGRAPDFWVLSREMADELANDSLWVVRGLMPGRGIINDVEAGTLKICGVPIVLEKDTRVEFVPDRLDIEFQKMAARLHDKDIEILRLKQENERLRCVAEVALKAANPVYKVDIPPMKTTMSDPDVMKDWRTPVGLCRIPGGFGDPDPAPPSDTIAPTPKSPLPLRALSNDRQPIGLRGWK